MEYAHNINDLVHLELTGKLGVIVDRRQGANMPEYSVLEDGATEPHWVLEVDMAKTR